MFKTLRLGLYHLDVSEPDGPRPFSAHAVISRPQVYTWLRHY